MRSLIETLGRAGGGLNLAAKAALMEGGGRLVALSDPSSAASLRAAIGAVQEFFGERWAEGDVAILNDPDRGATHVCQLTAVSPAWSGPRIVGWAAVRGNLPDLGGWHPGGYSPQAVDRWAEAARFEPAKLLLGGRARREVADLLRLNSRTPALTGKIAMLLAQSALRLSREAPFAEAAKAYEEDARRVRERLASLKGGAESSASVSVPAGWDSPGSVALKVSTANGLSVSVRAPGSSTKPVNLCAPAARDIVLDAVAAGLGLEGLQSGALADAVSIDVEGGLLDAKLPACVGLGRETAGEALGRACAEALAQVTGKPGGRGRAWMAREALGALDWATGRLDEESVRRLFAAEKEAA